jgi:DNA-binding XRE family transcriptional regulator
MECSCPDWATMCKHVAAVLYGVGARLDDRPELLFLLRGVDHEELIDAHAEAAVHAVVRGGKGRRIAEKDLGSIFGVDIDAGALPAPKPRRVAVAGSTQAAKAVRRASEKFPTAVKGSDIRGLRERLVMTRREFSRLLGVSEAAVSLWERSTGELRLHLRTRAALESAWADGGRLRPGAR